MGGKGSLKSGHDPTPQYQQEKSTSLKEVIDGLDESTALRMQVEYIFSDENLRHDRFFRDKISADPDGWLDMNLILKCDSRVGYARAHVRGIFLDIWIVLATPAWWGPSLLLASWI